MSSDDISTQEWDAADVERAFSQSLAPAYNPTKETLEESWADHCSRRSRWISMSAANRIAKKAAKDTAVENVERRERAREGLDRGQEQNQEKREQARE